MMRRLRLCLAPTSAFCCLIGLLAGCGDSRHRPSASARPAFGTAGFDDTARDTTVRAGDDFFRYANGAWVDRTTIPPDRFESGTLPAMTDTIEVRIHRIMEEEASTAPHQPGSIAGKVGAFYKSFMDEARIEEAGAGPLRATLDQIRGAKDRAAVAALMGCDNRDFEGSLFAIAPDVDLQSPARYALYVWQAGLGLPDRDYYLQPEWAATRAKYQEYVSTLLRLLGWPDPEANAKAIVSYETDVARASWSATQRRDFAATYNAMTLRELTAFAPGFPWTEYFEGAGLPGISRVVVQEKSAFPRLAAIFARTPLETLRAWLAFTTVDNTAPYLAKPYATAYFEMRDKAIYGQSQPRERWRRAIRAVAGGHLTSPDRRDTFGNLGWGVGQLYTARYFTAETKGKIEDLVANLETAYHARIQKLDWMGEETKAKALEKLDIYKVEVGYPDKPRDYSNVVILDDDLVGNVRRAAEDDWRFHVGRMTGPVDRSDWPATPQTNDAFSTFLRTVVFPAGRLQPPIFDPNADPAFNYGAAGGVIGHELTHGFDDQGRTLDAQGRLVDWWTPQDAKTFETRAGNLASQYSTFEPLPGLHLNGRMTLGENIADLGGLTLALDAYHASLHGKPAPVVDGWTGDQRVFLGWAQLRRGKVTEEALRRQVVADGHSPFVYRVNGVVRNIDAWYVAFDIKPGDRLYIAPSDRVHIW